MRVKIRIWGPDKAVPGVWNECLVTIHGLQDPKVRQRRRKYRKDGESHEGARGAPTLGESKEKNNNHQIGKREKGKTEKENRKKKKKRTGETHRCGIVNRKLQEFSIIPQQRLSAQSIYTQIIRRACPSLPPPPSLHLPNNPCQGAGPAGSVALICGGP